MDLLFGYRLIRDPRMTELGTPYEVPRTWKDRLFSWPWRPLFKSEWITPLVPSKEVIVDESNRAIIGHPETIRRIEREIAGGDDAN